MSGPWGLLRVAPCGALADPLSGLLVAAGALGTWQAGDALLAYFPPGTRKDTVEARVAAWLGHLVGPDSEPPALRWEEAPETDWTAAARDRFVPIPVGRRLVVLPEWSPPESAGDRIAVRIRPGTGFGTGDHPTTAMCLEALERALDARAAPCAVLDVGTGSGILALAAARLGAGPVVALDTDPDAIANARANRALNALPGVGLVGGGIEALRGTFDVVLANLLANLIVDLVPDFRAVLAPGGRLVLAGLLTDQGDRVEAALVANGLAAVGYEARAGWLTLEAEALETPPPVRPQ